MHSAHEERYHRKRFLPFGYIQAFVIVGSHSSSFIQMQSKIHGKNMYGNTRIRRVGIIVSHFIFPNNNLCAQHNFCARENNIGRCLKYTIHWCVTAYWMFARFNRFLRSIFNSFSVLNFPLEKGIFGSINSTGSLHKQKFIFSFRKWWFSPPDLSSTEWIESFGNWRKMFE